MCKLGLHEQLLKEEMKTPVLGTLGIWLSVEISSGHPQLQGSVVHTLTQKLMISLC